MGRGGRVFSLGSWRRSSKDLQPIGSPNLLGKVNTKALGVVGAEGLGILGLWNRFLDVLFLVLGSKKLFAFVDTRLDRPFAFFPVGWANFSVFLDKLEGLDHSERFVNRATQG